MDGFFHGDPHPGNILADPESRSRSSSSTSASSGSSTRSSGWTCSGSSTRSRRSTSRGSATGCSRSASRPASSTRRATATTSTGSPGSTSSTARPTRSADALGAFLAAVFNNGLILDSQLTLAMKAVIQAEETARALSFDIDLGEAAVTEARAALLESFTPENASRSRSRARAIRIGKELARQGALDGRRGAVLDRPVQQGQDRRRGGHQRARDGRSRACRTSDARRRSVSSSSAS